MLLRRVPSQGIHENFRCGLAAIEDIAQQNAVVIAVWLGAKHSDLEPARRAFQYFFDHAGARHAIADDYEFFFAGIHITQNMNSNCAQIRSMFTWATVIAGGAAFAPL